LPGYGFQLESLQFFQKGVANAPRTPLPPAVALNLALAVVASSNAPMPLLDSSLIVIAASKSFYRAFQIESGQVEGRSLTALGGGEWNVPQLTGLLKATASGFAALDRAPPRQDWAPA